MKAGRKIAKSERNTYDRLFALVMQRQVHGFRVPQRDRWEVFETEADYTAALGKKDSERTFLTQAEVRAKFAMDPPKEKLATVAS